MSKIYFEYGEKEMDYLKKKDKKLGAVIERMGVIKREVNPDLFAALVECIVGQQISSKAADTVCARLRERCGPAGIGSGPLCAMSAEAVQSCGMSMRKAETIKHIAEAAAGKIVDFATLADKSDADVIQTLTTLKGVGVWTAEMLLIFSLKRPNVVSFGDLAIRRGMMRLYGLNTLSKEQFARYAKRYAPYGSVASLYLWSIST